MQQFKDRLIHAREAKRVSQSELARLCEMAPTQLARYENGKAVPRRSVLQRIANVLEVSSGWLATGDASGEGEINSQSGASSDDEQVVKVSSQNMEKLRALSLLTGKSPQELLQEMIDDLGSHLANHGGSIGSFLESLNERVTALEESPKSGSKK